MNDFFLLIIQSILYLLIPFLLTFLKNPLRLICFYIYLGTLLVFADIMGSIYSFTILDGIKISGGNIAFVVILFTIILMVILEKDIHIIRNVAIIIIIENIFFFLLYKSIYAMLGDHATLYPKSAPVIFLDVSLEIAIIGSFSFLLELFLLFFIIESIKKIIKKVILLIILYPLTFAFIIFLDGLLFTIITSVIDKNLYERVMLNCQGKLFLGLIFCVPMYLLLIIHRKQMREFSRQSFSLADLLRKGKKELLSEIRKQQTALHERDQLIKAITESAQDCIFSKNREFRYTFVNPAMCKLLKCKPDDLLGKTSEEIFDPESAAIIEEVDKPVIEGKVINSIHTLDIHGISRIFHTVQVPLYNQAGEIDGICGIVRDVTDLQKAEKKLEKLNNRLQDKNRELEQIIYATSHDLRSPLVNIKGFSEELQFSVTKIVELAKSVPLPAETSAQIDKIADKDIPRWVEYIINSITRMSNFLSNLLKISRLGKQSITFTEVDMNILVKALLKSYEFQINRAGIIIEKEELPACITDSERISQVFTNLIDNAIKYLKPGEKGHIRITGETRDKSSFYYIEDNGIGIEEKYLQKIFEIFYRMNPRDIPGEGIGLTIVKKALNMIDGEISVKSTPGTGSQFTVKLPAVVKENLDEYSE